MKIQDKKTLLEIKDCYLEVQSVVARQYKKTNDEEWIKEMEKLKTSYNILEDNFIASCKKI